MNLIFQPTTPYLTLAAYAEKSGQSVHAVTTQADRGQLPIETFNEPGKRGKRYVNMVLLYKKAAEQQLPGY